MLKVSMGSGCCGAAILAVGLGIFSSASLAQGSRPHVVITTPQIIQLPVIPQGNYLDPARAPPSGRMFLPALARTRTMPIRRFQCGL